MKINKNYQNIEETYLFSEVAERVRKYMEQDHGASLIKMGIGDVTRPLCKSAVEALHKAADEMGTAEGFHGYGPEQGYGFLRDAIADYYQRESGVKLFSDEIFVSDGAKSDLGNILDIFDQDNVVAVTDPVYPVYVDTNVMAGRKIVKLSSSSDNGFLPMPFPGLEADIIYLCSPNNPSGNAFPKAQLREICDRFPGIVVIDEAYADFSSQGSMVRDAMGRDNLIILQTMSKARAMAGLRIGLAISNPEIIHYMSNVKYPYNLSRPAMEKALSLIDKPIDEEVSTIVNERDRLSSVLPRYAFVKKVFPSDANFLLVRVDDANGLYDYLLAQGIIVRNRTRVPGCAGCLRLTVGLPAENDALLNALDQYSL